MRDGGTDNRVGASGVRPEITRHLRVLAPARTRKRPLTVCAALTLTSWAIALYALLKTVA